MSEMMVQKTMLDSAVKEFADTMKARITAIFANSLTPLVNRPDSLRLWFHNECAKIFHNNEDGPVGISESDSKLYDGKDWIFTDNNGKRFRLTIIAEPCEEVGSND